MGYRKWIYRRLPLGLVALGVLFASTVWGVSCQASRRIEEHLDRIRAADEPVSLAEVTPPPVPDGENAAVPLGKAFRILEEMRTKEEEDPSPAEVELGWWGSMDTVLEDPWTEQEVAVKVARAWAARRAGVRPLLASALKRTRCRFEAVWAPITDPEQRLNGHVEGLSDLAQLNVLGAALSARRGDGEAAYAQAQDSLRLASLAVREGSVLFSLIRMQQEGLALDLFQVMMSRVQMKPTRRELLSTVLGELDGSGKLARVFVTERCFALHEFDRLDELGDLDGLRSLVPSLVFRLDRARYLELAARGIDLARRPYAETREAWAALRREVKDRSWYQIFSVMFMTIQPMTVERTVDHLARIRLARFALSIEASRKGDGTLPAGLEANVTWVDPCDGQPLRCRPTEDGGYLLWSVGHDGVDDGGWDEESDEAWESDVVWRVAGRVPAPAR